MASAKEIFDKWAFENDWDLTNASGTKSFDTLNTGFYNPMTPEEEAEWRKFLEDSKGIVCQVHPKKQDTKH